MKASTLILLLLVFTVVNYGLHTDIMIQDENIRFQAKRYVEEHCPIILQEDLVDYEFLEDLNISTQDGGIKE